MKVIIVEDEPRVRKGLSEAVEWEKLGMQLVGTASNGLEGMELFSEKLPDLVIADIRMPVMDGLEMTEAILKQEPSTKVIIISGHDEFEYARRCIGLGVNNYLLKPIGKTELQLELTKLMEKWVSIQQLQEHSVHMEEQLEANLSELRSLFLEGWLNGEKDLAADELEDQIRFYKINLNLNLLASVVIFEMDSFKADEEAGRDQDWLDFSLYKLVNQTLKNKGICYQTANGRTIVLYQGENNSLDDMQLWTNQIYQLASELSNGCITVAIGSSMVPVIELPDINMKVKRIMCLKMMLGTGLILQENMIQPVREQLAVLNEADEALLVHSVEINDPQETKRIIDNHFAKWTHTHEIFFGGEIFYQFTGLYTKLVHRLGRSVRDCLNDKEYYLWQYPEHFHSLQEIQAWWIGRFNELSQWYEGLWSDRKTKLIKQVIHYVDDHIYDNITRDEVANHVYINSSYLSRLFREVTGESFSNYVLNKKIEKAIHLLQVERVMVYEVANRLGYKDPSYFARVLKKHTGKSPTDFQ